jgi:hypothetical protein
VLGHTKKLAEALGHRSVKSSSRAERSGSPRPGRSRACAGLTRLSMVLANGCAGHNARGQQPRWWRLQAAAVRSGLQPSNYRTK